MLFVVLLQQSVTAQDYYYSDYKPFDQSIESPEVFLGHAIGDRHTRHDQMVYYFKYLAAVSPRATLITYGHSHEGRPLVMLCVSAPENLSNMAEIQKQHLQYADPSQTGEADAKLPLVINMGYSVHGNEPSTSEAALLTAYTLVASEHAAVSSYRQGALVFIDPAINPDGRERHSQWANMYKANVLVSDKDDVEHNEAWPRGRANHYWFDLNRDWLLAIHPESRAKLKWSHEWYPNVIGDFHEMGTNSSFFFEPMKTNGAKNPIMPKENYQDLNELFAAYFVKAMDKIGSLYFTKDVFDGTYPGYGSSYGDLQGGLALLFEQGSSRGHVQETPYGDMTFGFTIRNQYVCSMATLEAAVNNQRALREYQRDFFKSALSNSAKSTVKAYTFDEPHDQNRLKAFIDKLLIHKVKVYKQPGQKGYLVPTQQPQYRMVQTFFETYSEYHDSVFYDASAWSLANFYNISYGAETKVPALGAEVLSTEGLVQVKPVQKSEYAYLIDWADYNSAGALYHLQANGIVAATSFSPFSAATADGQKIDLGHGTIMVPVAKQDMNSEKVYALVTAAQEKFRVPVYALNTGYSTAGRDLGGRDMKPLKTAKALMLIGEGTSSLEAGEVWHLLDTRVEMPLTKVMLHQFSNIDLDRYNTMVIVSGNYGHLDTVQQQRIKAWAEKGNTIIAIGQGVGWLIGKKMVKEALAKDPSAKAKKEAEPFVPPVRLPFEKASEILGRERLGGVILRAQLDLTHPLAFGYRKAELPVYKNNTVWLMPSENPYATVAAYTSKPHIDGYISPKNMKDFIPASASLVVSQMGKGRAILFADNPNFRGSWYGTNRLFLNALFFGQEIGVPQASSYEEE